MRELREGVSRGQGYAGDEARVLQRREAVALVLKLPGGVARVLELAGIIRVLEIRIDAACVFEVRERLKKQHRHKKL